MTGLSNVRVILAFFHGGVVPLNPDKMLLNNRTNIAVHPPTTAHDSGYCVSDLHCVLEARRLSTLFHVPRDRTEPDGATDGQPVRLGGPGAACGRAESAELLRAARRPAGRQSAAVRAVPSHVLTEEPRRRRERHRTRRR